MQQREKEITWLLKEKYRGKITPKAKKDIERIKKGEPVDYVIGFVDFLGCRIDLSQRPFIPEEETAYWVSKAIEDILQKKARRAICLDIFAGSGAIGIAVLKHIPFSHVDFAENEKKFLAQIEANTIINEIDSACYTIIQSDVFSEVKGKYDYIFANPPYIAKKKIGDVQKSVLDWEPHGALFGGEDGLDCIRLLLSEGRKHLKKGGIMYVEFDDWQVPGIKKFLKTYGWSEYKFYKDQFRKWRWVKLKYYN